MPLLRNPRLEPGSAFTWFAKDWGDPAPEFALERFAFHQRSCSAAGFSHRQDRSNQMKSRVIALGLAALAWMSLVAASLFQTKPTGEFVRFQQCPYHPEVESLLNHTFIRPVDNDRRGLEKPFLGLNCYVGSIANSVRQTATPNNPSRSGQRSTKFFGSNQSTGAYACRTLTVSLA